MMITALRISSLEDDLRTIFVREKYKILQEEELKVLWKMG